MKKIYPLRGSFSTDSGYFNKKNLINHSFTLIQLSNDLFLWSLPFLIIGGFLWVFFFGFLRSFSAIGPSCTNKEPKEKPEFSSLSSASYGMYSFWLIIAGILIALSAIFMLFFFVRISEYENEVATFAAASFFSCSRY